jgi:isoleucyl-tRNA synthetase
MEKIIVNRIEKANLRVVNEGTLTVGLDTEVTEDLLLEGCVRDLVRGVQNLRKERGLEVTDRIRLTVSAGECASGDEGRVLLKKAFTRFRDYLAGETLASSATWTESFASVPGAVPVTIESGDENWVADLVKD